MCMRRKSDVDILFFDREKVVFSKPGITFSHRHTDSNVEITEEEEQRRELCRKNNERESHLLENDQNIERERQPFSPRK